MANFSYFSGDLVLQNSSDPANFGSGGLTVGSNLLVSGTSASTNASTGNIVSLGGVGVVGDVFVSNSMNVSGGSNLNTVNINTNLGATSISGSNSLNVSVGNSVYIAANAGNLNLASNATSNLIGANINLQNPNTGGIISLQSGSGVGGINLAAGSNGVILGSTSGNINTTSYGNGSNFVVASNGINQNLNLTLTGLYDNGINISSTGISATNPAIKIESINTAGNIIIRNSGGIGSGFINLTSGSGGISLLTNTGGSINLTSQAASSTISVNSASANQNLILQTTGLFNSGVYVLSSGISNAINILSTNTAGNVIIGNTMGSLGYVQLNGGSGGVQISSTNGSVNLTSINNSSNISVTSVTSGQNLNIMQNGSNGSGININAAGTGVNALSLSTSTSNGGIFVNSAGRVSIQATDNANGISIGTINSGVVNIGKAGSTTTVFGNFDVKGNINYVESGISLFNDNCIIVNNGPSSTSDGGVGVKRWQPANNSGLGSVVNPPFATPGLESGTAIGGSTSTITLASGANSSDNFYNGAWISIVSGTGVGQVRMIKSYVGSTKVATIYTTADQTGVLSNPNPPSPVIGLDFATPPDSTSVYNIYPNTFAANIWRESANEFAYVYTALDPSSGVISYNNNYANLHINNLIANNITANAVNGTASDINTTVTLTDNSLAGVNINLTNNYGIYILMVKPSTASGTRPYSVFIIGRSNSSVSGTANRLISIKGASNSILDVIFPVNAQPQLKYSIAPNTATTTVYNVRAITL